MLYQLAYDAYRKWGNIDPFLSDEDKDEFNSYIKDIMEDSDFQSMKKIRHHENSDLYTHSYMVSYFCFCYSLKHEKNIDRRSLVRGALLHDFYLYDWRDLYLGPIRHGFYHPRKALLEAEKRFPLDDIERSIIRKHMWPLTFYDLPDYNEVWIVVMIDKLCAVMETRSVYDYSFEGFSVDLALARV